MKKLCTPLWFILLVTALAACGSLRKAELASGNEPEKAIVEVTQIMNSAQQDHVDVLADAAFSKGSEYLQDAQQGLKRGEPSEAVLENTAIAKALFEDANKTAETRRASAKRILTARASALAAGVRSSDELIKSLLDIDDDLKSDTKQFSRTLSTEDFSEFQKRYLALEAQAVQFRVLNDAKQVIDYARENDAEDLVPESLRTASLDYATAMNMIAQSPRSPDIYNKSVEEAQDSATQLYDVMNVILGAKGTPEHIAVQIVKQRRALGDLNTSLGSLKENLKSTKQTLEEKEGKLKKTEIVLKTQEEQLARASTQVRFQQAMDEAQKMLSEDDALVYQQGNKLVFRLKRVNFRTGTANVPELSKLLISKVNAIVKKLDAEKIVVQGHTDSVGSAEVNKKLSTQRATAVAKYLAELRGGYKITYYGFGESQPLVSNETKAGRATNRRVDLVVTVKQ